MILKKYMEMEEDNQKKTIKIYTKFVKLAAIYFN